MGNCQRSIILFMPEERRLQKKKEKEITTLTSTSTSMLRLICIVYTDIHLYARRTDRKDEMKERFIRVESPGRNTTVHTCITGKIPLHRILLVFLPSHHL